MLGQTNNPALQSVEQAVQEKVPQEMQEAFQRIVTAGEAIMYSPESRESVMQQMNGEGDPAESVGEGVAKLFIILLQKSKGSMPMEAGIPAAQVLLCEGLDFMEKAGKIQATPDIIASATKAMMGYLLQLMGVSQEKLQQLMQAGAQQQSTSAQPQQPMPQSGGLMAQQG